MAQPEYSAPLDTARVRGGEAQGWAGPPPRAWPWRVIARAHLGGTAWLGCALVVGFAVVALGAPVFA
ncbi:MAG TPA: hypothetical protein VFM49_17805, partial [Chloroflexia bacterium]|nr:hypothetical protein [Chloroflexia bacterium]